jgi:hypothetical protein
MATTLEQPAPVRDGGTDRALRIGLGATFLLIVLSAAIPTLTGWNVNGGDLLPVLSHWVPRVGAGTLPALLIAAVAVRYAADLAMTARWGRLLVATWVGGVAWILALATVDGSFGLSRVLGRNDEYLQTARSTTDLAHTLSIYVSKIPLHAPTGHWPVHIAGHPAGALTFFVALVRIGLGSNLVAGLVVVTLAATTAVAVLVTLRLLGAETLGRRALPFLVLGPSALWQGVSADAMFAAVAAWGIAALACAATRTSLGSALAWSVVSGLVLGYTVMLSYGLPLIGILAFAVLVVARSWRPLIPTAIAAAAVLLVYAAYGFNWFQAVGVLRTRYWAGIASERPGWYWIWGNLAALASSAGPLLGVALTHAVRSRRSSDPMTRVVLWLSGAGVAMVLAADVSQMSRAETERIFLPFIPWLLLSCALLPESWRRRGLVLQIALALLIAHLFVTPW